jgi:molybdenum cofactor biosynthesis protein B
LTHAHAGSPQIAARLGLLTVSDTRTVDDDRSGAEMRDLVTAAGHEVFESRIVPDEPEQVRLVVHEWLARDDCDGVITSGGTGVSSRDQTYEALVGVLDQRLDGFGELFRMLSWEEIGSAAMISRAFGGVARGKLLFALPGSTPAVRLALDRLILPELSHLIAELRKR